MTAVALFGSYLIEHIQKVNNSGEMSESWTLQCGVLQGSLVGPVLFAIYVSS